MKKIKITQVKSAIDRPERQKLTLRALGLNKMNASREVVATDQILGMVRAVNHLIKIEDSSSESGDMQAAEFAATQTPSPIHFTKMPEAEIVQPALDERVEDVSFSEAPVATAKEGVANSTTPEVQSPEEATKA